MHVAVISILIKFMFLLDTNIISELRRPRPHGAVVAWIQSLEDHQIHLSSVTIGEIQAGIEITREQDQTKAQTIETWLQQTVQTHNIIAMDAKTFRAWAKLMHRQSDTVYEDAMIAATAMVNQLTVATRNTRDFERFGVKMFNPFEFAT
jgi:toxin FitB